MKVAKRKLIIFLLMVALISNFFEMPMNVSATSVMSIENDEVQPRYTNLQTLQVIFHVDQSNGDAIAGIITSFYSNTDYIVLKVEFQKFEDMEWKTLATARTRKDDSPTDWETYITVKHGYYYRAVVTVKLYEDGEVVETVTLPSKADYY